MIDPRLRHLWLDGRRLRRLPAVPEFQCLRQRQLLRRLLRLLVPAVPEAHYRRRSRPLGADRRPGRIRPKL